MISESELRAMAQSLLQGYLGNDFPYAEVAGELTSLEESMGLRLSAYGYLMWVIDKLGCKCNRRNMAASGKLISEYAENARKLRDDMPLLLLNASRYATSILSNVPDINTCLDQLEGMTFPYVLYVLFAGSDQESVVSRYRPETAEQLRRYPSTLDLLPESYKKVGKEVLDADANNL